MSESNNDKAPLPSILGAIVALAIPVAFFVVPRVYGTTPRQLMDEPMAGTPKSLARDLRRTTETDTSVKAELEKGSAGDYENVMFTWSDGVHDTPTGMRLRANRDRDVGDEVTAGLRRRLHAFRNGKYAWGAVTVRVSSSGDASFEVAARVHGKPNPLLDRQVEAAKEVVLNAAFGLPVRVSDREIVDMLGTGYSPAEVARFDPHTRIEDAAAALRAAFPAMIARDSSTFEVPLDHPLVREAQLSWVNEAGGRLWSVSLEPTAAYAAGRATLEKCLAQKIGPPKVDVTDYGAGKKDYAFAIGKVSLQLRESEPSLVAGEPFDPGSFALVFQALAGCRDAPEMGGATK